MKRKTFKKLLMIITLVSFFVFIFTRNEGDLKLDLYNISISIFSSMILVFLIDEILRALEYKDKNTKHVFIANRLAPYLNDYYDFYLFMYITTRENDVPEGSKVLQSLFSCRNDFNDQVLKANPFFKPGFRSDRKKYSNTMRLMLDYSDFFDLYPHYLEFLFEAGSSKLTYEIWQEENDKFNNGITNIINNFSSFVPPDTLMKIGKIIDLTQTVLNMSDFISMKGVKELEFLFPDELKYDIYEMPIEFLIDGFKFFEILGELEKIMIDVGNILGNDLRKRDTGFFNNRNVKPNIGDSYKFKVDYRKEFNELNLALNNFVSNKK